MSEIRKIPFILEPPHGRAFSADACFIPDRKPKPVVVFVHGFKGFKDWGYWNLLADYFAGQGFVFVKLNLSHNGATTESNDLVDMEAFGNNNFSLEMTDLGVLLDYLTGESCSFREEIDPEQIGIIGHSRGGGLVLLKAREDARIKAVATWASVSHMNPGWGEEVIARWQQEGVIYNLNTRTQAQMPLYYQLYEDYAANPDRFDVKQATAALKQPLLIVHGAQDPVVPVSRAYELLEQKPDAEVYIVPGADHSFGGSHPYSKTELPADALKAAEKTVSFFRKNLNNG
ncbi:alpha/beta hydrolase family protein [Adhaeribacter soli]|uniref:Alpha/beta fold hydrolase n=1 Tax=Adhaeribacter soli TaxID=2607655 RepID=A0A5N1J2X4_9BACT|nr:alpha/beta fold hydrolase [Adhaeribacter soli]KAA9338903.1 alpha/beta fold hydrolase [Adhaeribacter soli]